MIKFAANLFFAASIGCAAFTIATLQVLAIADDAPPQRTASLPKEGRVPQARNAPSTAAMIDFHRDIQPIFVKNCYACHGATQARSGLRFDLRAWAFAGGDSGPVIIRGHSADSLLIQYVSGQDAAGTVMPPKETGKRLNAQEIALLNELDRSGRAVAERAWKDR